MKPTIVTLTGMTCSGKSTLEGMLKARGFSALISTTTRSPRAGDVDGVNYHFISKSEFMRLKKQGGFIENVTFGGHYYGVSVKDMNVVTAKNCPAVLVVEPGGRDQVVAFAKKHGWVIHTVYVDNPDEVIAKRFMGRFMSDVINGGLDTNSVIDRYAGRMATMIGNETIWRREAYTERFPYSVIMDMFDDKNCESVVDGICQMVGFNQPVRKVA